MCRFFKALSICFGIAVLFVATGVQAQSITLYNDGNFSGGNRTLTDSVPHLGALNFNNTASSVRVTAGRWELCDFSNYAGHCVIVSADVGKLGSLNLQDRVSSVRFVPTVTTPPPSPPDAPPTGPAAPPHEDIFVAPSDFFFVTS